MERVNNYRNMTGRGFSFLSIPRSYYGVLTHEQLTRAGDASRERAYSSLPSAAASEAMHALEIAGVISTMGVVNLDVTSDEIADAVRKNLASSMKLRTNSVASCRSWSRLANSPRSTRKSCSRERRR